MHDDDTLNSLGAKLEALDLDEAEAAALDELIRRAASAEPEVAGFNFVEMGTAGLENPMGLKIGVGLGRIDIGQKAPEFRRSER